MSRGANVQNARFIIFVDGPTVYAKNGSTGGVEVSGTASDALQYCLDEMNNSTLTIEGAGGAILFKSGTYEFDSGVRVLGDGIGIVAETAYAIWNGVVFHRNGNFDLITVGDGTNRVWGFSMYGIYFTNETGTTGDMVKLLHVSHVIIEGCGWLGCTGGSAIYADSPWGFTVRDSHFHLNGLVAHPTIWIEGSGSEVATDVHIIRSTFALDQGTAIHADDIADLIEINGCYLEEQNGIGISARNFARITNNMFWNQSSYALDMSGGMLSYVAGNTFTSVAGLYTLISSQTTEIIGNVFNTCQGMYGLGINDACVVQSNYFVDCVGFAIYNQPGEGDYSTISGNSFVNGNSNTEWPASPIFLVSCENVTISGNKVYDQVGRGIYLSGGNTNLITDNVLECTINPCIVYAGADTIVNNNIGYVTENKGTATISASTSVIFNHGLATTPTLVLASFSVASYGNYTWTATYDSDNNHGFDLWNLYSLLVRRGLGRGAWTAT